MAYKPPAWKTDTGTVLNWQAAYHATVKELDNVNAAWEYDRKTLSRKFEEIENLQKDVAVARKDAVHWMKMAQDATSDLGHVEEERDHAKADASRLLGNFHDAAMDYSREKDAHGRTRFYLICSSAAYALLSLIWIAKEMTKP